MFLSTTKLSAIALSLKHLFLLKAQQGLKPHHFFFFFQCPSLFRKLNTGTIPSRYKVGTLMSLSNASLLGTSVPICWRRQVACKGSFRKIPRAGLLYPLLHHSLSLSDPAHSEGKGLLTPQPGEKFNLWLRRSTVGASPKQGSLSSTETTNSEAEGHLGFVLVNIMIFSILIPHLHS